MRAEKLFKMDSVEIKSDEELISRDGKFTIEEAYQLFQNVPIEIAIYDLEGRYKYVNKHYIIAEDIRHEIIGKDDIYYFNKVGISLECAEKRNEYFRQAINEKRTIRLQKGFTILKIIKFAIIKDLTNPYLLVETEINYQEFVCLAVT